MLQYFIQERTWLIPFSTLTNVLIFYDNSRPRSEQSLIRWAIPQLHDIDALAKMVDPALKGLYPVKSLSRFADVIAVCLQVRCLFTDWINNPASAFGDKILISDFITVFGRSLSLSSGHQCQKWCNHWLCLSSEQTWARERLVMNKEHLLEETTTQIHTTTHLENPFTGNEERINLNFLVCLTFKLRWLGGLLFLKLDVASNVNIENRRGCYCFLYIVYMLFSCFLVLNATTRELNVPSVNVKVIYCRLHPKYFFVNN